MKRLSELSGDALMDVLYALTPILPIIESIDYQMFRDKEKSVEDRGIAIFANVLSKLWPTITSKENRHCAWEIISILDEVPFDEAKSYPMPKLIFKIRKIFSEGELTNFLSYAEESEAPE